MYQQPKFDEHQFGNKSLKATSADYRGAGEWDTTGISFQDLGGMHVKRRTMKQERRIPTPEWAMSDTKTRQVVLNFVEDRFYIGDRSGSDQKRIQHINDASQNDIPRLVALLEKLQRRYRNEPEHRKNLAIQIQNVDSQIVLYRRGALAVVVSVIYKYWREGLNSVEVAEQLNIKSPLVRVWCWRLIRVERYLSDGTGQHKRHSPGRPLFWTQERVQALKDARASGRTWKECGMIFGRRPKTLVETWRKYVGEFQPRLKMVKVPKAPKVKAPPCPKVVKVPKPPKVRVPKAPKVKVPKPPKVKVPKPPKVRVEHRGMRASTPERLRYLFLLRTSGKTWKECGAAMGTVGQNVMKLWHRHFGDLNSARVGRKRRKYNLAPDRRMRGHDKAVRRSRWWTPERLTQLKSLRETDRKTFRECAEVMGLRRGQAAQHAYARFVLGVADGATHRADG